MPINCLYICPWSLRDPLCQSQSLAYIKGLAAERHRFALITFESGRFPMPSDELAEEREKLQNEGIDWHPIRWGSGNSLTKKVGGIIGAITKGLQIGIRNRTHLVHSRSSLPVFMAVVLKKLLRTKFLYDADSLLSEEYLETGHFSHESRAFKFLAWSESWGRRNADHIIVLTERLKTDYQDRFGVNAPINVIPCCVDLRRFENARETRKDFRDSLGVDDDATVYIYVGKAGSWYMVDETFELFKIEVERRTDSHLLIISQDPPLTFDRIATRVGVPIESYTVRSAGFESVASWMGAADVAISLVKPLSSKRGSSPVKFAEYLASGLPVISTAGIGDIDALINNEKVGALLTEFDKQGYERVLRSIDHLSNEPHMYKEVAKRFFDLDEVGVARYRDIYSRLLISE
jgi:glycosyltransferase involved in cell wall biosynthesis